MNDRKFSALVGFAFLLSACGAESPEEQLQEAADEVATVQERMKNVTDDIADTRTDLEKHREAVRDAEQSLAAARRDLRKLQKKLAAEEEDLDIAASDTAIFRLLQSRLLEDELLASAAINLFVLDSTVVLYGDLESPEQKVRANDIAAGVPGVTDIRNFIDVRRPSTDASGS